MSDYQKFLDAKRQLSSNAGFEPLYLPDSLFDFQSALVEWGIWKGRAALFEDCGLGKTLQELVWAENVARHADKPVLILTPLIVSHQTVQEGEKFGIECARSSDGSIKSRIVVTNYERLHYFSPGDFAGVVCDESSILKSFDGATRLAVTEFMRKVPYRLLATATAAPNDYIELGTSSEALGELGYTDMLNRFFKNDNNNSATGRMYGEVVKWRFKGHAERPFWRWVSSWARATRKPSDLGFADGTFILPSCNVKEHTVRAESLPSGYLFSVAARNFEEQREEKRRTIKERCEQAAALVVDSGDSALMWCHLNDEGDLLESLVPGAIQISGTDSDEAKEEKFLAFISKQARVLVTKPKIGGWGLNLQHCAHTTYFPSHSYEQFYQCVRRFWRFGQTRAVNVDIVLTDGERAIMQNLIRKADAAEKMFAVLVEYMNDALRLDRNSYQLNQPEVVPAWL